MTNDKLMTKLEGRTEPVFFAYESLISVGHSFLPVLQILEKIRCSSLASSRVCVLAVSIQGLPEPSCAENVLLHGSLSCMSQSISETPSLRLRHPLPRNSPRHWSLRPQVD